MQILKIISTIVAIIANGALVYFAVTALFELRRLNRKLTGMERHDHCDIDKEITIKED